MDIKSLQSKISELDSRTSPHYKLYTQKEKAILTKTVKLNEEVGELCNDILGILRLQRKKEITALSFVPRLRHLMLVLEEEYVIEEAARESEHDIKAKLQGADMVFITCGLGGGTGTGSAPVIADIAKKLGILTVAIVTLPFSMEGNRRYENALMGLEKLEQTADTLIVIPNDKLLQLAPDLPLQTAFKVADEILTNSVKGIAELITKTGLVNLDFADIRTVMGKGGVAMIGVGESDSESRAVEAVEKAISNPLLDVDITGANGALINITGGADMTLEEARKVVETISERLDDDARIIWGAQISEDLDKTLRAMLIVTGVSSPQIFGRKKLSKKKKDIEKELGIEFI